jgi:hypothetical protein
VAAAAVGIGEGLEAPAINEPFDDSDIVSEVYARFGIQSILWIYTTDHHNHFMSIITKSQRLSLDQAVCAVRLREPVSRQASPSDFRFFLDFLRHCVGVAPRDFVAGFVEQKADPWDGCGAPYRHAWLRWQEYAAAPAVAEEPPAEPPGELFPLPNHRILRDDGLARSYEAAMPQIRVTRAKAVPLILKRSG